MDSLPRSNSRVEEAEVGSGYKVSDVLTEEDLNEIEAHVPCTRQSLKKAAYSWIDSRPGEMPVSDHNLS